ncbi:hypothetical protein [Leptospira santarosai]|uniref:hypothetical protein n=1 Tax=Leptospira santarosai TaxID=28183 RepID=UPI003F5F352C
MTFSTAPNAGIQDLSSLRRIPLPSKIVVKDQKHFTLRVSRQTGFHRKPLAEPYVSLSTHTAPIIQLLVYQ